MFRPSFGKQVGKNDKFRPRCAKQLSAENELPLPPPPPPTNAGAPPNKKESF